MYEAAIARLPNSYVTWLWVEINAHMLHASVTCAQPADLPSVADRPQLRPPDFPGLSNSNVPSKHQSNDLALVADCRGLLPSGKTPSV